VNGSDLIAVRVKDGKVTHVFGRNRSSERRLPAAFERLAWFDEPHFLNEALSYVVALPMLAILIWPIMAGIVWLVRRRSRLVAHVRAAHRANETGLCRCRRRRVLRSGGVVRLRLHRDDQSRGRAWQRRDLLRPPPLMRVLAWAPVTLGLLARHHRRGDARRLATPVVEHSESAALHHHRHQRGVVRRAARALGVLPGGDGLTVRHPSPP
jgi:hypothetical protein